MINGRSLMALVGGFLALLASPLYAGTSVITLAEENGVSGILLLTILAFFALTMYEDWKDAKQARQRYRQR